MPFDMNQLFENPSFAFGASLLGNARQPGAMNSAFGIAQKINDFKQQRDYQNQTLAQTAALNAGTSKYREAEAENQKAEAQNHMTQNMIALRKQYAQEAIGKVLAQKFHMDPSIFAMPPMPPMPGGDPQAGAQPMNAMQNPIPGSNLNMPPVQGMVGGAQMEPATPAPQDSAPPQQMPNFPMQQGFDPAGPMNKGNYGQPGLQAPGRPMLRTGADIAPAIFGQESGNRNNIGNSVNGAVGPGQVMPATFQRFAKPGEQINNPRDNRAVATRYLDYLAAKSGGDPAKIAAGYFSGEGNIGNGPQPFKRDVRDGNGKSTSSYVQDIMNRLGPNAPTGYTQRVLAGMDQPPVATSGIQGPPMANPGMEYGQLGALMASQGMQGGPEMMEYAKMNQPQTIAAESYQRDPVTGMTQFYGSPSKQRELAQGDQRLGIEQRNSDTSAGHLTLDQQRQAYEQGQGGGPNGMPQKVMNAVNQNRYEAANADIQKSFDTYKELPTQYAALNRAQADVQKMIQNKSAFTPIGTAGDWKKNVIKTFTNTFGTAPSKDVVNAEDFDAAMAQLWMKAVKQVDQNPTAKQQAAIQQAFGTRANDPAALNNILEATKESFVRQAQRHNSMVSQYEQHAGPDPFSRYLDLPSNTAVAASSRSMAGPKAGTVESGYVFLGGDPKDKASWAPVPKRGGQ